MGQSIKTSFESDIKFKKYTHQILESEQALGKDFESLHLIHPKLATSFLLINSLLIGSISFYKLGVSKNSILTLGLIIYVNAAWNLFAIEQIFKSKIRDSSTLCGYWHRQYFTQNFGKLSPTQANKSFEKIYIEPLGLLQA